MNPETCNFEHLTPEDRQLERQLEKTYEEQTKLLRPNGEPVPSHWAVFVVGETVVVKDQTFKVAYINEGAMLLEPIKVDDMLVKRGEGKP